jgi:hypothetical protein
MTPEMAALLDAYADLATTLTEDLDARLDRLTSDCT